MISRLAVAATIACALAASPAAAQRSRAAQGPSRIETALRAQEVQWNRDWASRDVQRIVAHYAPEATVMAPGFAPMSGVAAIRAGLGPMLQDPALDLRFTTDRVFVARSGDLAYTRGHYTMRMTDPQTHQPATDRGTYVTIWRRMPDGRWLAIEDINTSGAPAP